MELKTQEFEEFRTLVYDKSGITLGDGKESLVSSRIRKRMRTLGLENFRAYLDWIQEPDGQEEIVHMLDAISTNVTSFFREAAHFNFVRDAVTRWRQQGQKRFRFWSAACSSGEEPYSLAMTLAESGLSADGDVRILATDLSSRILDAAKQGEYTQSKIALLPPGYASRYFTTVRGSEPTLYRVQDKLRERIVFLRMNLSTPPFPMPGPLDIIFVRNVMIYFDNQVRKNLIADCYRLLKPGGYLLVGHAESLTGLAGDFKCVQPSVYAKPNA